MQVYGVDLAEWYAAGRWTGLLELIDELPDASRYYEAIANDPELAGELARARMERRDEAGKPWSPRISEFNLHAQLAREQIMETKLLRRAVIASAGGKPGEEKPFPSPRTAVDEAFEQLEDALSGELLSQFGFSPGDF